MLLIRKGLIVQLVDFFPEIGVKVFKAKILPLFKDMEKALFKDLHSALNMALEFFISNY